MKNEKTIKRDRRHNRVRSRVIGNVERPRLCIFRSTGHIYAQVIDDETKKTLCSASDIKIKEKTEGKVARAALVGKAIAEECAKAKIKKVAFDRGGFSYHGRVKALADAAREAGLEF